MPRRVNPIILLGIIIAFVLAVAIFASAAGGGRDAALAAAQGQVGKPYAFGTDGPGTFSCTGLARFALRSAGVDANAPWDHGAYLGVYPNDPTPRPGDIVVYPSGVAIYVGGNQVVMANDADGVVGYYDMNSIGTPLGFANPYGDGGGATDSTMGGATNPAVGGATDPAMGGGALDPTAGGTLDPVTGLPLDQGMGGTLDDQGMGGTLDPVTGLPLDQGMGGTLDPVTGLPLDQGMGGTLDPVTGLPLDQGMGGTLEPMLLTAAPSDTPPPSDVPPPPPGDAPAGPLM